MKIVVTEFMSLDGVVQAPGGPDEDTDGEFEHGGWSMPFFDPEIMGAEIGAGMDSADALLFGRRTWQAMAAAWPDRAGDPFADEMNSVRKYVVSTSLSPSDMSLWENSVLLPSDEVAQSVASLRDADGGDILVWGSSQLVQYLAHEDLIDEYRLMIEPILLGGGKRIFPQDGIARTLTLRDVKTASTGVIVVSYTRN